jgi:hypothetical protein
VGGIHGLLEGLLSSSRHICDHRALCTVCIVRQEYSEGLGLTLSASCGGGGGTNDCASEFSLRLFEPFGRDGASDPGNAESLNAARDPRNVESRSR